MLNNFGFQENELIANNLDYEDDINQNNDMLSDKNVDINEMNSLTNTETKKSVNKDESFNSNILGTDNNSNVNMMIDPDLITHPAAINPRMFS